MRPLIINDQVRDDITAALARAMDHVVTPEEVLRIKDKIDQTTDRLDLKDKPPNLRRWPTEHVLIPYGYRAHISLEYQPAGLCKHLSLSVNTPGRIPNEHAIQMVAEAFGMWKNPRRMWIEEFDPGHHAVNVVEPIEWPPPGGIEQPT